MKTRTQRTLVMGLLSIWLSLALSMTGCNLQKEDPADDNSMLLENDQLAEFYVERPGERGLVGNVSKGGR